METASEREDVEGCMTTRSGADIAVVPGKIKTLRSDFERWEIALFRVTMIEC
jgi:hypothetical protein